MSILCLTADTVSSGSCFIVFKVPLLKVAHIMFLYLSKLGLGSAADFLNTGARAAIAVEHSIFLPT